MFSSVGSYPAGSLFDIVDTKSSGGLLQPVPALGFHTSRPKIVVNFLYMGLFFGFEKSGRSC
jgi:hypothetical protein